MNLHIIRRGSNGVSKTKKIQTQSRGDARTQWKKYYSLRLGVFAFMNFVAQKIKGAETQGRKTTIK
jgi:hypothetical protein